MALLLDFAYLLACIFLSPWLLYRLRSAGDRRELREALRSQPRKWARGWIWLHGSSAGEVSLLKPLVALLERDLPARHS